ncbi:MAG: SHOCT domain-containing protein [Deltaproteobacteria bacterium]|nr:SHOCT domain-containing protein [Deltaproteobacteria bacterium]
MWGIGGIFAMILMFLFWAAVIVGIILFIRWMFTGKPISLDRGETALDILKKRLASGEIEREEFEEKKKLLE